MSPERQRQLLGGLVALLAAIGLWQYLSAAGGGTDAAGPGPAGRRPAAPAVPPPPPDVALETLALARGGPDAGGRNPFVFGARQAADTGDSGGRRATRSEPAPPPALPAAPPGPPPLPPIPLKFIGFVEGTATTPKIAVLSDSKGLVVHGTVGAIIDGRYRILAIGPESIDIAYADGRGRQTLRLSGQ